MYRIKSTTVIILCVALAALFFTGCTEIKELLGIDEEDLEVEITKEMLVGTWTMTSFKANGETQSGMGCTLVLQSDGKGSRNWNVEGTRWTDNFTWSVSDNTLNQSTGGSYKITLSGGTLTLTSTVSDQTNVETYRK